ncbi:MAG: ATP-dependent DNA helicase RecG [Actinomycetota bacterium]|nr:MAG: ATP-dependent DNA helicase RecG [Actinomycetota bacterium]
MPLRLSDPIVAIDRRLASRRQGTDQRAPTAHVALAEGLGLRTVADLLHHYPRRYIDRSTVVAVRALRVGEHQTTIARVRSVARRRTRQHRTIVTVTLGDASGVVDLVFFNQPWIATLYRPGLEVAVSGVVVRYGRRLQFQNFEVEILRGEEQDLVHTGRITPVHPATDGISPRTIRELVHRALERLPRIEDPVPEAIRAAEGLIDRDRALRWIHFPEDDEQLARARERLTFDELFVLELGVGYRKRRLAAAAVGVRHEPAPALARRFLELLPVEPTKAQLRAIEEISAQMARPTPMNALLQGDVGSGKTLVAVHAALVAIGSGHQAAIMAPTEVLAAQHARSVASLLHGVGGRPLLEQGPGPGGPQASLFDEPASPEPSVTYALLTGSTPARERERILAAAADGALDLLVGTHALIQEGVAFADLSLAVVDEQHRFGLHQRMALRSKGRGEIDTLILTATPIPRTLALTYYGDLDVVVLDELPAGRQPVRTLAARTELERARAYDLVRAEVEAGHQAFVVCAAIDEDNRTQVRAAESEAARLATEVFPDLRVALLHGRMPAREKERVMEAFRSGAADVLIATTVIEVGVDVPNATVMLVEDADRFGLAQLHQLRGRIGRGAAAATCVLFDGSDPTNLEARARIDAMVRTTDGFELADEDLRLRGEGTLFDVRQSGMPDLRLARLADDLELVKRARARAFGLLDADPSLERHPALLDELRARFARSIDWLFAS